MTRRAAPGAGAAHAPAARARSAATGGASPRVKVDAPPRASVGASSGGNVGVPLRGFAPVVDRRARTLILGSFPGEASLQAGHYYAHPRNQFWTILGEALGEPLAALPFEQRYRRLRAHRIALWDVIGACHRAGSLDADIRAAQSNDFASLLRLAPALERVLFNGRTAGRFEARFRAIGLRTEVLPSTSPAHAGLRHADKLAAWRAALRAT